MKALIIILLLTNSYNSQSQNHYSTIVKSDTKKITLNSSELFGWKHFEFIVKINSSTLMDSILNKNERLNIEILNSQHSIIEREVVINSKTYPDSKRKLIGFREKDGIEIKRKKDDILSVKVYKSFKTKSSHHKLVSQYRLTPGAYYLRVNYKPDNKENFLLEIPILVE